MPQLKSALETSAYFHPLTSEAINGQIKELALNLLEQGYEYATLTQYGVAWAEDQDPFGHVMWQAYGHFMSRSFIRFMESFQETLGEKFHDFMAGRGISLMTNRCNQTVRRAVKYPDLLITGIRISEVLRDRVLLHYSMWSTTQKAMVAEMDAWTVFFNHRTGKKADLPQEGGVYADLYTVMVRRMEKSNEIKNKWEENQKVARRRANL